MSLSPKQLVLAALLLTSAATLSATELEVIGPDSKPAISGKEVDWIYGDYLMRNAQISVVIAAPLPTRDANLTVRNIGGSLLDLTLNHPSNDQLSAFIPTAGRYLFQDPSNVKTGRDGDAMFWECRSSTSIADDGTTATVRYRLGSADPYVQVSIAIEGDKSREIAAFDGIRADRSFSFESKGSTAYCADTFFRQTIGFQCPTAEQPPSWKNGRPQQLHYTDQHVERDDRTLKWTVRLYPATSPGDLASVAKKSDALPAMCSFKVTTTSKIHPQFDSVTRAKIILQSVGEPGNSESGQFTLQTDDQGIAHARLAPGKYVAMASSLGFEGVKVEFESSEKGVSVDLPLADGSGFDAKVTDSHGNPIPVKATIYAAEGEQPKFGPDSTRTFIENCVYSVHGQFHCPLDPGKYEVHFSRGPEYNSVVKRIDIAPAKIETIAVQLDRVVETAGWISADLHSHSSPSGDNTSDQFGRVENLLCEHVEFAPCTEHNRISSYMPHLEQMKLAHLMATCTGIELTGSPLPVNHQNSFPLHHHPHTQNGGGPRTSSDPVVQIERLAMWDNASDKVVQMNHPNLHQIFGDADTDGTPDKGFRGMLKWTDVIEVHPLETIFKDIPNNPPNPRGPRIPLFQWMQLLNHGYRIPAVINTDAHYNHHGSGWRRNWFACSTDDPAKISTEEMIRQVEAGHIVMSTGPFLSVEAESKQSAKPAIPGDDLVASEGKVTLQVSVQCPNWLDVNRVQVFVNGRPSKKHNFTRRTTPELFGKLGDVRKFEETIELTLKHDAHVIVATIGEGITLGKVMGGQSGALAPIAVSNPIFVDVDGKGFQPNGDELGLPLPHSSE